ncbi:MAG: molybdopterin-dependent oxidoreductase, partial [Holophagales bacterium]|nr:molybdopterin-dependent oxidoreductase [Holophagales bacterium]
GPLRATVPDVDHTDHLLVVGANPLVSNGSLMTAPDVKKRLKAIRQRGGKLVVVDPRRTETAKLADEHHFIRPGTDALLLAAMLRTIFEEGLDIPGRLADAAHGLDPLRRAVKPFDPQKVAPACGLQAETIRALARELAAAESAVAYGRMGLSTQEFGGLCQWLLVALNFVTGNLDRPGGAMFTRPAVDLVARKHGGGSYGRWKSRIRGLPEFAGELPSATLAEDLIEEGEGRIRGLITAAGNPVLSTPNGPRLEAGLGDLELMVSIDLYINETTRHAHLILPPTSPLEHDHYDLVFHALAIRNTARYSPALFPPREGALHDWQILLELQRRLDPRPTWKRRIERWVLGRLGPSGLLDIGLRKGPYGKGFLPWKRGLSLEHLRNHPHGVDLGALEPCMPGRLRTKSGRIELAPELFLGDLPRLERRLEELTDGETLQLVGRRQVRSNNSWMHNYRRLMRGKDRCTLLLHPDDAARRGVADGTRVRVRSRVGEVEVPVEVSEEIMPGVVSLPHGWGHGRPGVRLGIAADRPGASINDLTDHNRVDELSGNAALSGVPVVVAPAAAEGAEAADPDTEAAGG